MRSGGWLVPVALILSIWLIAVAASIGLAYWQDAPLCPIESSCWGYS